VERFMQRYYRAAREVERLNQLLLQHFEESVLHRHEGRAISLPGGRFSARAGFLEANAEDLFSSHPLACLEAFWWLAACPWLRGMRATTLRQLHSVAAMVRTLRHDPEAHRLFLGILRQSIHGATTLMEMNRYGVLGHYIPAFRRITAHMQFDLFHTYTVDQHALFVVHELSKMRNGLDQNRLCIRIMQRIPKPELLAVAALFHDLAKGSGGDHSRLGAALVRRFAKTHGLSSEQRDLVAFLVANHLLLSLTAQRRDISDPQIIMELTRQVGDPGRLDHLFLLTVADMRATNPHLLTAWKMSLLMRLYERAQEAFASPSPQLVSQRLVRRAKRQALRLLKQRHVSLNAIAQLWQRLNPDYFRQHDGHDIAAETLAMLEAPPGEAVVALYTDQRRSATVIFVASPPRDDLFVLISALIRQMGFAVEAADLLPRRDHWVTASWTVLEEDGQRITSAYRLRQLRQTLTQALVQPAAQPRLDVNRTQSSRIRAFSTPTQAIVTTSPGAVYTQIELVAPDRPGLLSQFGHLLGELGLRLRSARVATIGERAEDVFLVTDTQGHPIIEPAQLNFIAKAIEQHLGAMSTPS
jgi:[protein-PII] uridylyltransferase